MADLLSPTTTVREVFLKATSRGDLVTARHLLAIGADPNWRSSNTSLLPDPSWSSLHVAACYENEELLDLLLDQPAIEVNMKTELQKTPLMMACVCGKTKSVKKLLQVADIEVNSEDQFGGTALHVAARYSFLSGIVGCVQLLSQDPRVDINHKDTDGTTPLMSCLELARVEMAKILLANPKVEVHTRNKEGKNAEDIARLVFIVLFNIYSPWITQLYLFFETL